MTRRAPLIVVMLPNVSRSVLVYRGKEIAAYFFLLILVSSLAFGDLLLTPDASR